MRSLRALSAVVVMVSLVVTAALAQQRSAGRSSQNRPLALVGGTLIDGTGSAPIRDSVVLIRGQRIEKIGTTASLPVPDGYEAVSTEGLTVLPGLWDLHVHLMYAGHPDTRYWFDTYTPQFERVIMPASAEQLLMAGVTSVRDLAAPPQPILAVKKRIASGEIPGPTLYVAGPALTKGGNPNAVQTWNVSGAADATEKTRQLIDDGVDWIKIVNAEALTPEEMKAIVDDGACSGAQSRGSRLQRRRDSAGVDRRRRRFPACSHPDPGIPSRHRRADPRSCEKRATVVLDRDRRRQRSVERRLPRVESGVPGRSGELHRIAATDRGRCAQSHRRQDSGWRTPRRCGPESG